MAGGITAGASMIGGVATYKSAMSGVSGNVVGSWNRGASAYELAVQNGFQGTVSEWLDSIRGESIKISHLEEDSNFIYLTFSDDTLIKIPKGQPGSSGRVYISKTYTDDNGNTVIIFSDKSTVLIPKGDPGVSPVISTTRIDNGYRVEIDDINGKTVLELSDGEKGEQGNIGPQGEKGDSGQSVEIQCEEGVLKWRHTPIEDERGEQIQEDWQTVADLNEIALTEYDALFAQNKPVRVVDELPDIDDADEGVIYVLREEV